MTAARNSSRGRGVRALAGLFVLVMWTATIGSIGLVKADDDVPGPTAPSTSLPSVSAQQAAGTRPGGQGKPDREPSSADAAPPPTTGFVDEYGRLWNSVQRGNSEVKVLSAQVGLARRAAEWSASDLVVAMRARNNASFDLANAQDQYENAVRSLYITGSTDVDVVLGVMGSEPDEVLRNIDSFVYLKGAAGSETVDYEVSLQHETVDDSLAAAAQIRAVEDRSRAETLRRKLRQTRDRLKIDKAELQRLVAAAAPQTVVGKSGCPKSVLDSTVPLGVSIADLCENAVKHAATPQAAVAIKWALIRLGAPYACGGVGRMESWRYDCSSYVSRAYAEGAGLGTAGNGWAPSTRNMVPWDGASLDRHYAPISPRELKPGDLVLYNTCPEGESCTYRHVAMYLGAVGKGGAPMVAQTNECGGVAHVAPFLGVDVGNFLGARRVVALSGERVTLSLDAPGGRTKPGRS